MPEIFDLSKIKRLVEEKRPPAILIVDTNVLMNEPDFSKWETSIGKPIFVLPDTIMVELEYIKTKPEPREKAIKAIKSVNPILDVECFTCQPKGSKNREQWNKKMIRMARTRSQSM